MRSLSVLPRRFPFLFASFALAVLATRGPAQDAPKGGTRPIVLVPPFENLTKQRDYVLYDVPDNTASNRPHRHYRIDRYTEAPRALFEDVLVNMDGVSVVERKRVDTLLVEAEFGQLSGLVDPAKAIKLGKLIGANRIVIGTIADVSEETRKFKGYGIQTENMIVSAELRVRVLDIESGRIAFSKVVKGSKTYSKSSYGETKSSDRHFAAVKAAVAEITEDDKFKAAVQGKKAATVEGLTEVEFAPKPDNCDIEIDGKYVGGSPLKRKLKPDTEYKVRITKAGYKEWTGVITPEAGLKITRELEANK
jgi:curli biogenesis system outer membrane secretion channel CsgG